jgi:hypothetical protein
LQILENSGRYWDTSIYRDTGRKETRGGRKEKRGGGRGMGER